jgi:ABC-type sugar transport system ATPase subunit
MVFQNLALFPHMTGRENIIFPLKERGASEREISERLDFVSEVLHVSHILHKNPAQMSGGERQRIALGRAFAAESRAMLLDEPIAALDARLREEMRVELKRLQRENNQTFIYVSHDEEEVMAISDRVAVIIDGKIAQIGTPDEVYGTPNSLAVAEVIGSPPMNFFKGRFNDQGVTFECNLLSAGVPIVGETRKNETGTLGVRPEDIWLGENQNYPAFDVTVSSVEPLGSYTIINALLGDQILKIRAPGQVVLEENAIQRVTLDARHLHLFDESGIRV